MNKESQTITFAQTKRMKKLLSIRYSAGAFNFSMFLMRLAFGCSLLINHGLPKLMRFAEFESHFYNFLGLGTRFSLILVIFAEVFCSLFIILGLFTRIAVIPLIIMLLIVIFKVNAGKPFLDSELAVLFITACFTLLLCGPGRISVDGMINK